jgi:hypothetical protein
MTFINIHKKKNNKVSFVYTEREKNYKKRHWANSSVRFVDKASF